MPGQRRRRQASLRESFCARVWCRPLFCMRPQFAVIVMVAVVMAVLSALLGSYTWGIVAPGLSARRAISGGAFHLAVTAAQAVLWWRFTEGAQLPPALWIAYALFGGVARGSLRVWTILESDSETAAAAIQAAELASRPMELLAYRCFYAFVLIWQVLVSPSPSRRAQQFRWGERRRAPARSPAHRKFGSSGERCRSPSDYRQRVSESGAATVPGRPWGGQGRSRGAGLREPQPPDARGRLWPPLCGCGSLVPAPC